MTISIQSFRTSIGQNLSLKRMLHEDRKAKRNRENYQSQLCSIVLLRKMQRREIKLDELKECAEPQMRCRDELFSSASVMQYKAAAQLPIPLPVSSLNFPQSFYPLILRLFSFLHTIFARELSYVGELAYRRQANDFENCNHRTDGKEEEIGKIRSSWKTFLTLNALRRLRHRIFLAFSFVIKYRERLKAIFKFELFRLLVWL